MVTHCGRSRVSITQVRRVIIADPDPGRFNGKSFSGYGMNKVRAEGALGEIPYPLTSNHAARTLSAKLYFCTA